MRMHSIFQQLTENERTLFQKLNSPQKIQDFVNSLEMNFEDNYQSPRRVLQSGKAQCLEGAMLAAAILWSNGEKPLLLDLQADKSDVDHVVALFKGNGHWGAISKTNHAVLRYREPIYKTVRELAMSYFHEYFDNKGKKNMRTYSQPFDLSTYDDGAWVFTKKSLHKLAADLDNFKHYSILTPKMKKGIRRADKIEITAGKIVEWRRIGQKTKRSL